MKRPDEQRGSSTPFDPHKVRADFPILSTLAHGKPLIYLDNAATTQKPRAVIDAVRHYYESQNANIHRGVYQLSQTATAAYEGTRLKVQKFINAAESTEVIYTRGTTEGINLVASSWGRANLKVDDEVIISAMEHHSNIVPWQIACELSGAKLRVVPVNDAGELMLDEYAKMLSSRTKMVAIVHASNSLGTVNDVKRIAEMAHAVGAKVLVDGAQAVAHGPTDVRAVGADFYAFSGHKLFGPTGIGILYGRRELLDAMPPYQGGGDMISSVTFEKTTYAELPSKFEAGTPHIAGVVGLGEAIDYLGQFDMNDIAAHEQKLLAYATQKFQGIPGVRIIGTAGRKSGVLSFVASNPPVASLDIGTQLDLAGIAVRTGHHCCQPVMDRFEIPGTVRASISMYSTTEDVDAFIGALQAIVSEAREKTRSVAPVATMSASPDVVYPKTFAGSPTAAAQKLADDFGLLEDWADRYAYIIEMGEKLPLMPLEMKTEPNRVRGCQSTVHLWARKKPGTSNVMEFLADSDADIVRGLIAILERLYSGQKASEVLDFDIVQFFSSIGLDQNLSMTRRNGLSGMVERIRLFAKSMANAQA